MKAKTAFESGNSPPKVSESGAPIQTGRGLEETKRRITEAFQQIRQDLPSPPLPPPQVSQLEAVYTEQHKTHFQERAKRLSLAALETSHISKTARHSAYEIVAPTEDAQTLFDAALRRFE